MFGGVAGFFEQMTIPLQRMTFGIFHQNNNLSSEEKLKAENAKLLTLLAKQNELEKENKALHDQFETSNPAPTKLLSATIVGTNDDQIIIDKGASDALKIGEIIVYKDNLVGKIVNVSQHLSIVNLVTRDDTVFTAKSAKTDTLGVVKGTGGETILFGNVVLSDKLEKDDLVVTKGDLDSKGQGYPPGLIVGKIISVNKKASNLFQQADVKSLVNFSKLNTVFVME